MVNHIFTACHTHLFSFQNKGSETVCITYCKATSGIFPDDLKLSKVSLYLMPTNTRIPKTIDQYLLYQFERIVYNLSIVYLNDNKIQSNHQSGSRF